MAIDVDKLLADVAPDDPSGPSLAYDKAYYELQAAAQGKPPREEMAGHVIEGEDPSWRDVRAKCVELLGRTKDLGVVMMLVAASTALEGMPGLADGLTLLKGLLEKHWDGFHPRLDPDDGNDPLERVNLIAGLASAPGSGWQPTNVQRCLRRAPLARSRQLGQFGLRDVQLASGEVTPGKGESRPDPQVIDSAFRDTDAAEMARNAEAAGRCVKVSKEIDDWLTAKVGAGAAPDLSSWHRALKDVASLLGKYSVVPGAPAADAAASPATGAGPAGAGAPAAAAGPALSGSISTRDDVQRAFGKILEYYQRHEPSSPVPLLVRRAQRLVSMGFAEALRELAPSALDQLRVVSGEDPLVAGAAVASGMASGMPSGAASVSPAAPATPRPAGQKWEPQKLS